MSAQHHCRYSFFWEQDALVALWRAGLGQNVSADSFFGEDVDAELKRDPVSQIVASLLCVATPIWKLQSAVKRGEYLPVDFIAHLNAVTPAWRMAMLDQVENGSTPS